jgi:hypothetical protein
MKDKLSSKEDILDYTPTFAATAEVAKGLVVYIDRMPTNVAYGEDDSPDHLRWMVDQIVANAQSQAHPVDKLSRWLGYVQGILRAHRVLDTVAERDRTRPIFHAAYIEMGIKPPEKRDRQAAIDAVFERPDLEALVHEWSFPFRNYVIASFMRGLTRLGSITDDLPSAHVTGYFHSAIFGNESGYLRRALGVDKKEAEFRFGFFEQFMERTRAEELKALSKGNAVYLAGSLVFTGLYALGIITILLQATSGNTATAILTGFGFAFAYGLTVIVQTKLRRIRDKALLRLPLFRKSLPWREEDISGVAILDDMQQGRPGRES